MRKKYAFQSGLFNARLLAASTLCFVGVFLGMLSFAATPAVQVPSLTQANWTQLGSYTPPVVRQNPVMVNDIATGQVLLFGGQTPTDVDNHSGFVNDTWTFNGQRWIQLYPPASPSPRGYAAAAYDAARHLVVVFGGATKAGDVSETWTWNGITWTQQQPAHAPSARFAAGMAYDPATERVVLFGGVTFDPLGVQMPPFADTWTWDGSDWTQQSPTLSPPGRFHFGFADGSATSVPVLFGGNPGQGNVLLDDTWTWDGPSNSWTLKPVISSPSARFGMNMAYDPQLGKTVLFGGSELYPGCQGSVCGLGNQYVSDTWTWDGTQWAQVSTPTSPDGRVYVGMAFDPVQSGMTLFGGVTFIGWQNDTWRFDGSNWIREDLTAPDELDSAMLGRERQPGTAILFGGDGEHYSTAQETWRWDSSKWVLLAPANSPLPRSSGNLVFDGATDSTILFGGSVAGPGQNYYVGNDTWSWDGTDWSQLNPAHSPPARFYASAAYDAATGEIVLFGGFNNNDYLGDTWTWNGLDWTEQHPLNSPPARITAGMAYDATRKQVVLFGGTVANTEYFNDTWTWDGSNWTEQTPTNSPPARAYTAMAYDPTSSSVILFGGCSTCFGIPTDSDTWSWNGLDWTELQPTNVPTGRGSHAMVDGNASSPVLMFGGMRQGNKVYDSGTPYLNDLWAFNAALPVQLSAIVSRKTHGSAGPFDVDLPLTGPHGIECRSGGANGDYTIVFTFANTLTSVGGASLTSGTGSIRSRSIDGNDAHNYIVNLTGVSNAQTITVSLTDVNDAAGNRSVAVAASMSVLLGDINADNVVSNTDVALAKAQVAAPVGSSNFRDDVNVNGLISNTDISTIKAQVGTTLP